MKDCLPCKITGSLTGLAVTGYSVYQLTQIPSFPQQIHDIQWTAQRIKTQRWLFRGISIGK
jgi:hypothetical protein